MNTAQPPTSITSETRPAPGTAPTRIKWRPGGPRPGGSWLDRHGSRAVDYCLAALLPLVTIAVPILSSIAPYNPIEPSANADAPLGTPGHLLGTDEIGRDILSRVLVGLQISWFSALITVAVGLLIGGIVGLVAGAIGGWVDYLLMRITDLFLAHPGPLITITIVAALGYSLDHTLMAVAVFWWPFYARMVRGEAKAIASSPHVQAARLSGTGRIGLLFKHIMPGVIPTAIVAAGLDIANAILALAGLSFLGLGQPAPYPELGADASRSMDVLLVAPWVPIVPGVAVLILSLIGNVGGNAVRRLIGARR
jgi:peptide/nickel transport system permease protein